MAELIIVFREVLEGALIVGILYTYLNKTEQYGAIKWLWQGVTAAIVASIFGSILFQIFADGFEGRSAKLFEGIVLILAAAMLGTMIVWMALLTFSRGVRQSSHTFQSPGRSQTEMFSIHHVSVLLAAQNSKKRPFSRL